MAQGKVKWFDQKKGFGFIEQAEGADLFVHFSAMVEAGSGLNEGDVVEYTIAPGAKGEMATEVTVVSRSEATTTSTSQSQPTSRPPQRKRFNQQGESRSINRSLEDQLMALRKSAKENQQDLSNRLKRR